MKSTTENKVAQSRGRHVVRLSWAGAWQIVELLRRRD